MTSPTQHGSDTVILKQHISERGIATLTLNRPQVHNAFNPELIEAMTEALTQFYATPPRALILTGEGKTFSAGADLAWMQSMIKASESDNIADALRLAKMLRLLDELPCPTIARVNGHAFGGGVGLITCCDLAVAVENAQFGLTEVRLGLSPATIAPFVVAKIGIQHARRLMLTAERFDAPMAEQFGLITHTTPPHQLDGHIDDLLALILAGGPEAQAQSKALIRQLRDGHDSANLDQTTAEVIAKLRVSEEGQEGLRAFLEKRHPHWAPKPSDAD